MTDYDAPRLAQPGDRVHIVDVVDVEQRLRNAGIPAPTLNREMRALAANQRLKVKDGYAVKKTVAKCPLGPYYHLDARLPLGTGATAARTLGPPPSIGWDPQWAAPYTVEWWQQMLIRPEDLPVFESGSHVHLIPLAEAEALASIHGYDISGLGSYVPPLQAVGELRKIVSVDYDFDASGRVTYVFHIGHPSHTLVLRLITSFFFREFWDAVIVRTPPPPRFTMDDGDMTIEN